MSKRPRGPLSSSPDFEAGRGRGQAPSSNWLGESAVWLGGTLPSSVYSFQKPRVLSGKASSDPEWQASLPPGHFYTGEGGFQSPPPNPSSANHKSSTSLQLVTGQDPGQTLPPSKSDSPPPHWRQPSLWGWGWGGVRGPTGTDLSPEAGLEECSGQFYRQQGEGAGLDP